MLGIFLSCVLLVVLAASSSLLFYQARTGVPPMAASSAEIADVIALLKTADLKEGGAIYELGSGWGTLVIALARAFPTAQIRGIELSSFPCWVSRFRTRMMPNVRLQRGTFYDADLRDADAVTCYLMVKPMPRLAAFLDGMLKPGTPVISITFGFRNRKASAVRNGPGLRGEVAMYRWPARN
jgi:hypothetical protein